MQSRIGVFIPVRWIDRSLLFFFFQAEDGIRDKLVTGVQTCALPISRREQAGDGLSSPHVPRRDEVRDEWDVACAALNLRRLRALGVAAGLARPRAARGGSPRSVTAQHGSWAPSERL